MSEFRIGPDYCLTPEIIATIIYNPCAKICLSSIAKKRILKSRQIVDQVLKEKSIIYGITTGFGSLKDKYIKQGDIVELQRNLVRSHSAGVGDFLLPEMVQAALITRLNSLAQGYSGVRLELLEFLCEIINRNIIPMVPSQGSVGSSGDLIPLAHIGLVLMGEGKAWYKGKCLSGRQALRKAGLKPIEFAAKEGLAWINGTSVMTGIAALVVNQAERLVAIADLGCALSVEAICGLSIPFDEEIHKLRPHPGQKSSAKNIRRFIAGSRLVDSLPNKIHDFYSIRCAPQVHGAVRDALDYAAQTVNRELNSVTDNPLVFSEPSRVLSGGNFHGEPIAITMDTLGIALSELSNVSERRIAKLINSENEGLPKFLVSPDKAGLHSGLMMSQYTAAALVSENKILSHPASVDSIPTSANFEDHVSMGTIAARKAWQILENTENVLAIEFLTAIQAIDFRKPEKLGKLTYKVYKLIREQVPHIGKDRELTGDIKKIKIVLKSLLQSTSKHKNQK